MRIVYLGSNSFGLPTLRRLHADHHLVAIVTQPDRPAGRGGRVAPTPVASWAADHAPDVPILKPERINDPDPCAQVRALESDAWVVIAYGQKLSPDLLAGRFAINLHASLLPRWRGAAPINAAIVAGDHETGNSVITIVDRMDAGLILAQSRRPIGPDQTAGDLHELLAEDGPALIEGVLRAHAAETLEPVEQDETRVTRAPKLGSSDAWLDFGADAEACRCRINGLSPWPGVTVRLHEHPIKLLRSAPGEGDPDEVQSAPPGAIVDPREGLVACGNGLIRLLEVKPASRGVMSFADLVRGRRLEPGAILQGGATP